MGRLKNEMAERCELALMGKVVPINSNDEVQAMTDYILGACGKEPIEDFLNNHIYKYRRHKVKYIVCNRLHGMRTISYLLESETDEDYPAPFEDDYGSGYPVAFCYVLNLDSDWCSEFGDAFFQKRADGFYHRVS